ncbi:MAG: adenosylmethionine decarboxylase [Candidatus Micrarchaeaceae archaeon]
MGIFKSNKDKINKKSTKIEKNNINLKEGFRINDNDRVVGKHFLGNLYKIDKIVVSNREFVKKILETALSQGNIGVTEIKVWPQNTPNSCTTILGVLQEGHVALHTWISYEYATIDIYITGNNSDPEKAFSYIIKNLRPKRHEIFTVDRTQIKID